MNLTLKTAPTTGLLDLQEVKEHCRATHTNEEDALIQGFIDAVQDYHEGPGGVLGRTFITQAWTGRVDAWPCTGAAIDIPLPPLISVDQVRYFDSAGVSQVLASTSYRVQNFGTQPSKLWAAYGVTLPTVYGNPDAIEVDFTAGYGGPEKLPAHARAAFLQMIADLYDNRAKTADRQFFENPTYQKMLAPLKVWYV